MAALVMGTAASLKMWRLAPPRQSLLGVQEVEVVAVQEVKQRQIPSEVEVATAVAQEAQLKQIPLVELEGEGAERGALLRDLLVVPWMEKVEVAEHPVPDMIGMAQAGLL